MTAATKKLTANPKRARRIGATAGPTVGAGYASGLLNFAVTKGASRAQLLARSQISAAALEDPDNRVPLAKYVALMRAGIELCGDPALALHYGEAFDLSELSIVGLISHAAPTLGHALVQINRYGRLVVEVEGIGFADRFQVRTVDGAAWLFDMRANPNVFPELTESTWARVICGTRPFGPAGESFAKEVHVTHAAPAHRAEYDRIFNAPTVFESDRNALLIDMNWTQRKVAKTTRYAFSVLSEHANVLLESLESSKTIKGRVESILIPVLHTGEQTIEQTAQKLGLGRQTLYRKLKAEGIGFEKLVDELRHKMALHYLNGKKVSVNETAYLVGFSDPSAFSRAFKRWTGTSPRKRVR